MSGLDPKIRPVYDEMMRWLYVNRTGAPDEDFFNLERSLRNFCHHNTNTGLLDESKEEVSIEPVSQKLASKRVLQRGGKDAHATLQEFMAQGRAQEEQEEEERRIMREQCSISSVHTISTPDNWARALGRQRTPNDE